MATLYLNIYSAENKKDIDKTYTCESYDLMLGTVEDLMQMFDVDAMTDNLAVTRMVAKSYAKLKPFIKDIFTGVTDEELKRVKVKELIPTFIDVFKSIVEDLEIIKAGN